MPDPKITKQEFAQKIKEKYPEYKDIDDSTLTEKMLQKYPEYKSSIIDGAGGGFSQFIFRIKEWFLNIGYWFTLFPKF